MKRTEIRGLYIYHETELNCPYLACGICKKEIKHKEEPGMVFYNAKTQEGVVAHKQCVLEEDSAARAYNTTGRSHTEEIKYYSTKYPASQELEPFLSNLIYNIQVKPKTPKEYK